MKTFGELTREEKIELFGAWLDGAEIEFLNPTRRHWIYTDSPCWRDGVAYRVSGKEYEK